MYEGGNLLMSWLTDADDGQTGGVEGVGVHSRGDGVDDNGASNVGGTGAESGINGLPDDVVANALPAGVATIDEVNDWPGSGDVIGIAAQGDGVYSPVGMAGAINGALPENNRSSVQSDPGVYENSVGKSYRGPGIVGNDDGGDGSKRNTNDPTTVLGRNVTKTTPTTERDRNDTQSVRDLVVTCLLYTSPSPRDRTRSRMPSSA